MLKMNKNIMVSLFKRRGDETFKTKIFDNFDQNTQSEVLRHLALAPDDLPVVASVTNVRRWCLITTKQTLSYDSGELLEIENDSISQVRPNLQADYMKGARQLKDLSQIEIKTPLATFAIEIEAGEAFWGIYNILSRFADNNVKFAESLC